VQAAVVRGDAAEAFIIPVWNTVPATVRGNAAGAFPVPPKAPSGVCTFFTPRERLPQRHGDYT
jgi:hypothetical protein